MSAPSLVPSRTCDYVLPVLSSAAPPVLHLHSGRQPPLVPQDPGGGEAAGGRLHRAQTGQGPGAQPPLGLLICVVFKGPFKELRPIFLPWPRGLT